MFKIIECSMPEDVQQRHYRDVGSHCARTGLIDNAFHFFQKSAALGADEALLYNRSVVYSKSLEFSKCLKDVNTILSKNKLNYKATRLENDCLFAQKKFEKDIKFAHNKKGLFTGNKRTAIENDLDTKKVNYINTVGPDSASFLYEKQKIFDKLPPKRSSHVEKIPLSRKRMAAGDCDCESYVAPVKEKISIPNVIKQKKRFRQFAQHYVSQEVTNDLEFLKMLSEDKRLSNEIIKHEDLQVHIADSYEKVMSSVKTLHASLPLYTMDQTQFRTNKAMQEYRRKHLLRLQWAAREEAFRHLEKILELAFIGNLKNLLKYVEDTLAVQFELKSDIVFPRKNEFINEISNVVALSYVKRLKFLSINIYNVDVSDCKTVLIKMLKIPLPPPKPERLESVFGAKSTYHDPDEPDYAYQNYKSKVKRLELRSQIVKNLMEKCFWLNEIAVEHMAQDRLEEVRDASSRVLKAALSCSSNIWQFLAKLQLFKCDIMSNNFRRGRETAISLRQLAVLLKFPKITKIVETAFALNEKMLAEQISEKERTNEQLKR